MTQEKKLNLLLGIFVTVLVCANLIGVKITTLLGVSVSVGIFAFPVSFVITDMVEEVFGKQKTKQFVLIGVIALLITFFFAWLGVLLEPSERYAFNEEYKLIFSSSLRMIFASLVAFAIAQYHDIWAFNFWKKKTGGKHLWLRNNASTITSQLIDSTVFMFLAFYLVSPKFDAMFIVSLIIPYWLLKIAFAVIDTPIVYLGVKWLKKEK